MAESDFILNRRTVLAGMAFCGPLREQEPVSRPPHILFVCPAGTVKSAIAREIFRRRARDMGIRVEVRSRGVKPEDHVSPVLASRLKADGVDVAAQPLAALSAEDIAWADRIIAFDSAIQAPGMSRAEAWDIPSWNDTYDRARTAIAPYIDAPLKDIARK
jgi:protein-tyrosine-phosphatase